MKFLHLSDLHIGRRLNGVSLLEDQVYIFEQVLEIIDEYLVEAIIISGDVYDSQNPSADSVMVLDNFLTEILKKQKKVFIIAGNHDSPERLSFGSEIMKAQGLYIEGVFKGKPVCVELSDSYGKICIHMLPFIKPAYIKAFYSENCPGNIETFDESVRYAISKAKINKQARNILITHQFVTASGNAALSDSETKYVGGLDNVDYSAFNDFDYVALGHLHSPQKIGRETVVYAGSPLKYSISERFQQKCAVIVDICEKQRIAVDRIPLRPLRDLRQIKGPLETLLSLPGSDDYISAVLTDLTRHPEPYRRLRAIYPNCIFCGYEDDHDIPGVLGEYVPESDILAKSQIEVFADFYEKMNGHPLDEASSEMLKDIFSEMEIKT